MVFQDLVCEIDETNYFDFLNKDFSVLHFFSEWHMNCLASLPVFEDLAREFFNSGKKVYFGKLNIEEGAEIAKKHKIANAPAVVFFKKGQPVARIDNFHEDSLRDKICSFF
jgi:thioredoxin-like negative regulator of GroEL